MKAFADAELDKFIVGTLQMIEEKFPFHIQQMGRDEMRALVIRGIERGERHAISSRQLLRAFIELTVAFGENFEHSQSSAWANEILNDPSLPPAFKVRMLEERLFSDTKGRPVIVV